MSKIINISTLDKKQLVSLLAAYNFIYSYINELTHNNKIEIDRNAFESKNKSHIEKALIFSTDKIINLEDLTLLSEKLDQIKIDKDESSTILEKSHNNHLSDELSEYENLKEDFKKIHKNLHDFIKSTIGIEITPLEEEDIENYITKDLSDLLPIYEMFVNNSHEIHALEKSKDNIDLKLDPLNELEAFFSLNMIKINSIIRLGSLEYGKLMGWLSFISESCSIRKDKLMVPDYIDLSIGIHEFYNKSKKIIMASPKEISQLKELIDVGSEKKKVFDKLPEKTDALKQVFNTMLTSIGATKDSNIDEFRKQINSYSKAANKSDQSNESFEFMLATLEKTKYSDISTFGEIIWEDYLLKSLAKQAYPITFTLGGIRGSIYDRVQEFKDLYKEYVTPYEKGFKDLYGKESLSDFNKELINKIIREKNKKYIIQRYGERSLPDSYKKPKEKRDSSSMANNEQEKIEVKRLKLSNSK